MFNRMGYELNFKLCILAILEFDTCTHWQSVDSIYVHIGKGGLKTCTYLMIFDSTENMLQKCWLTHIKWASNINQHKFTSDIQIPNECQIDHNIPIRQILNTCRLQLPTCFRNFLFKSAFFHYNRCSDKLCDP